MGMQISAQTLVPSGISYRLLDNHNADIETLLLIGLEFEPTCKYASQMSTVPGVYFA